MREELKASRDREEAAVKSRKELVAELSHDIKTPVASIKAMADVMSLTAKDELERDTISAINGKADQIDKLISNLFHATLEELEQLEVHTEEVTSTELFQMLQEADYMKKISEIDIKDAVVISDPLRINQVISNIIANSYKYAGTDITVSSRFETGYYILEIADKGG
jgi:signal transduction histidine kinase